MAERVVKRRKYRWILLALIIIVLVIKIISLNRSWIEHYYSVGLYSSIGKFYRTLFGWFPISLGDLLYTAAGIYLVIQFWKLTRSVYKKRLNRENGTLAFKKTAIIIGVIYIVFNFNWGLNYNRLGIGYQLQLTPEEHTEQDLVQITSLLINKVNEAKRQVGEGTNYPADAQIVNDAQEAYKNANLTYPFLNYQTRSVKRSLYSRGGNYFGFMGYFNPFTGESQLNFTMPPFLIPFVTCHEMAHQLGYANESEANFVGYLTATSSKNPLFHYSAYFDLFNYANRELSKRDSIKAKENYRQLDTLVKKDFNDLRQFYKKYKNPIEPIIWAFYDKYLKANQQDKGIESYNQVLGLLIAYHKKYGKL